MIYIVDIDGTICRQNTPSDYTTSIPYTDRIQKINRLYDAGHTIVYWTARGMSTGRDWKQLTHEQLNQWGCKYTELRMNKPSYDVWVDDKASWIFE
jgi:histidinol phosphatase-like enzyme